LTSLEDWRKKSPAFRYVLAILLVLAALGLRVAIFPLHAGSGFFTFYPGVALTALVCNWGPALLYVALSALAGAWILASSPAAGPLAGMVPAIAYCCSAGAILYIYYVYQRQLSERTDAMADLEEQFRVTFERAPVGVAHVSFDGHWVHVNQRLCDILHYAREELENRNFGELTHPEDLAESTRLLMQVAQGEIAEYDLQKRYIRKDGAVIWAHLTAALLRNRDGTPRFLVVVIEDITAHVAAEQQLRLAAKVFQRAGEGVMITDADNLILTVNEAFTRITGYSQQDAVGKTPSMLNSGRQPPDFYRRLWVQIQNEGWWQGEIWNKRKNGEIYPEWLTINAVHEPDGSLANYVAIFSDISAIKKSQQRLDYLASHDELTGLANRSVFQDRLGQAIAHARRDGQGLAVLFVDLDNFKTINDSLGHEAGDLLLQEVAKRLTEVVREADTLARLGGDEFGILLCEIENVEASAVCHRVAEALAEGFSIVGRELFITTSIGISLFPDDGEDDGTLLKNADAALYRAKERGRNQFQYFAGCMREVVHRRLTLETALRHALSQRSLKLFYQPKISIRTRELVGAEALLRWDDPELGPVSPAEFIPLAEKVGLITNIGHFVALQAIADLCAWIAAGLAPPPIAINVSPLQLRDDHYITWLQERLAEAGLPVGTLKVEVTESALMEDGEASLQLLDRLVGHGIKVSIDDFGTGYSSLSYLKRMPISELKIDRSFVDGIADQPDDRAIASAILGMAHTLGLSVVAEGVETEEQLAVLAGLNCDVAQGYYFHKPMEEARFRELL